MSIIKIAEKVGVSPSTVSRVLSNPDYKCSSKELRDRIINAAAELSYVPNEAARSLKKGVEKQEGIHRLGILVTRSRDADTDPFFNELVRLTESEIHKNTCMLSKIWYSPEFSDEEKCAADTAKEYVNALFEGMDNKPDGIIIVGKCCECVIRQLKVQIKNIVIINRSSISSDTDEVVCNGKKIASLAAEHLIRLGHRKLAYVGDCHGEPRFQGYRDTLLRYNLEPDIDHIIQAGSCEEDGFRAAERIMKLADKPTGIFCSSDIVAVGFLKALGKYRSRYYDPSVISADDISEARYTKPMLTTVAIPKTEMVRFALYLLLDRIGGGHKSAAKTELEGSLVIRSSCMAADNANECEYYI